jgi:plastocyanin domain-containing protein
MDTRSLLRWPVLTVLLACALGMGACAPAPAAIDSGAAAPASDGPTGAAVAEGAVQAIAVDLSQGFYDPTVIEAKAGVPLEITFGQGQGCLASVLIPAFSVDQDLTSGGAVVRLPAMKPGEYEFSCGMRMVFGTIVVK